MPPWRCIFTRGAVFLAFELSTNSVADVSARGIVTDGLEIAVMSVQSRGTDRTAVIDEGELAIGVRAGGLDAATLAARLSSAVGRAGATVDERTPAGLTLLPSTPDWDSVLAYPEPGTYLPRPSARSFNVEGAAYIDALSPEDRLEFFFDPIWPIDAPEPGGRDWWFGASNRHRASADVVLSFLGGSMGADETHGWVTWGGSSIVYAAQDFSTGLV